MSKQFDPDPYGQNHHHGFQGHHRKHVEDILRDSFRPHFHSDPWGGGDSIDRLNVLVAEIASAVIAAHESIEATRVMDAIQNAGFEGDELALQAGKLYIQGEFDVHQFLRHLYETNS